MNIGLPGTGIGGLFYLLSVFYILAHELYITIRGKSSIKRWKLIREQTGIVITMILMALASNYILSTYLFNKKQVPPMTSNRGFDYAVHYYQLHPILIPITLLFAVLFLTQLVYITLKIKKRS